MQHDRRRAERAFHDAQAWARRQQFAQRPELWRVDDETYLGHESWVRPALELLGDVRGCRVLDCGCGHGMATVVLARRGAEVVAVDLSAGYAAETQERARRNGVAHRVVVVQAAIEALPFQAGSFDCLWGHAILHHLDLPLAARELARVLRPGGRAVFCEPWGENPLLEWARGSLPYHGKQRSRDERPLRRGDLIHLRRHFPHVHCYPQQLLSMVRRLWPTLPAVRLFDRADRYLFQRWPGLSRFCRYMVLSLRS